MVFLAETLCFTINIVKNCINIHINGTAIRMCCLPSNLALVVCEIRPFAAHAAGQDVEEDGLMTYVSMEVFYFSYQRVPQRDNSNDSRWYAP